MRAVAALALACLAGAACAQAVQMTVSISGLEIGTATATERVEKDGSIVGNLGMNAKFGKDELTIKGSYRYSKAGRPQLITMATKAPTGTFSSKEAFTASHVSITLTENGKTKTTRVPIPKGKKVEDPSVSWFRTSRPKPGTTVKFWSYDVDAKKWMPETAKYRGQRTIKVSGREVKAHEIEDQDGMTWLDDSGKPLKLQILESGVELILERIWK